MGLLVSLPYILLCFCVSLASRPPLSSTSLNFRLSANANTPEALVLDEASIDDLNDLQAAGSVSSVDLVNAYVRRIGQINHHLHTVSEINPDALQIAGARDQERRSGFVRGPLHGIPILLKDNIATADALNTTAGSYALLGARPKYEATVAKKLRSAGAVILGKVTMGEWAQYRSSFETNSHGWSPLGGQTLGAYYPQQDPHGSSSGSAVAISVGLAAGSLGTETSGSIVNPAERNNVVGIKPTLGLTSRNMVVPISIRQDTVGPMAQTVKDAAYMLSAISGPDPNDNWTLAQPFSDIPDYVKACRLAAFKGAHIGVPRNGIAPFLTASKEPIMTAFEAALKLIRDSGAHVEDNADFPSFDKKAFDENAKIVLGTDFASGLTGYFENLATNPNNMNSLDDLIQFTRRHPLEDVGGHDLLAWDHQMKRNLTSDSEWSRAAYQANIEAGESNGITGALDRYNLDALVMPTFTSFYLPAIAGLPIITVPLGFYPSNATRGTNPRGDLIDVAPGIPFGLAFIGRKWSETTLISLAYAFEQKTMVRNQRKPLIRPQSGIVTVKLVAPDIALSGPRPWYARKMPSAATSHGLFRKLLDHVTNVSFSHGWKLLVQQSTS